MGVSQRTVSNGELIDGVLIKDGIIYLYGNAIKFDADGDTYLSASVDDILDLYIAGAKDFTFSANTFNILSNSKIQGSGSCIVPSIPIAVEQRLSGAGAITITEYYTAWTSTGANAGTLADGVTIGQLKEIHMVVDAGDATLTPTNLFGGTTITFADAGDYVILMWNGTDWLIVKSSNYVDGITSPTIA